jgi:hypothetical protein
MPASRSFRILCRRADGAPVPQAVVQVWSDGRFTLEASADAEGLARFPAAAWTDSSALIGIAAGLALRSIEPGKEGLSDRELVFAEVACDSVLVRDESGAPVPGALVAYWRASGRFNAANWQEPGPGTSDLSGLAVTGPDGACLVPRRALTAGCLAVAVAEGRTNREVARLSTGGEHEILVEPAYVACFRYISPVHGRPLVNPELYSGGYGWFPRELDGFRSQRLPAEGLALELLGVDLRVPALAPSDSFLDGWFSYFGGSHGPGIPEVTLRVTLPGYAEWTGPLLVPRLTADPLIQDVLLRPASGEFGIVVVDLGPDLPRAVQLAEPPIGRPVARLIFQSQSDDPGFFYRVTAPIQQRFEIRGVPFGAYRVYLEIAQSGWRSHDDEDAPHLSVGAEVSELLLDYEPLSTLQLAPRDTAGESFAGSLTLLLEWADRRRYARLAGPPYCVFGLPAGRVSVALRESGGELWDESSTVLGAVELIEGERTWLGVCVTSHQTLDLARAV